MSAILTWAGGGLEASLIALLNAFQLPIAVREDIRTCYSEETK